MKTWTLTASMVRDLEHYICYCDESPVDLLVNDPDYDDTYIELVDDLFNQFADYDYPEDFDSWNEEEQEDWRTEFYYDWCDNVSFEAYESEPDDRFEVLIDERE